MSNHIVSPSLMYPFVSWISSPSYCLLCAFCQSAVCVYVCVCVRVWERHNVEDSVGIPPMWFARLSCLLTVMNLIPNEMQQRSLWGRDVLPHPANSSSELVGRTEGTHLLYITVRKREKDFWNYVRLHRENMLGSWIGIKWVPYLVGQVTARHYRPTSKTDFSFNVIIKFCVSTIRYISSIIRIIFVDIYFLCNIHFVRNGSSPPATFKG